MTQIKFTNLGMNEPKDYIWCIILKDDTKIPLGWSKDIAYAMDCKDGYAYKDIKLYKLITVEDYAKE